ncbi:hypothetical protein [Enhygromyxa salina]|uniref:Protein BatD n=1 Tax=Enhygromyxa salina TaxID=215803 RepID=A0A2S9XTU6_9BACT|nr:hypothetical protein [Enhygromyxa salina]PRP96298.1 hypothetical protein ENSA7_71130 [Enhygromyxa salina]
MIGEALLALALVFASPPVDPGTSGGAETGEPELAAPAPAAPPVAPRKQPASSADAPITVTTRLTPDPSHIGDLLTLEVIVAYPRDHAINLPNGLDFAPLELVSIVEGEVESTGNDLRQRFTITLQHFDVGAAEVPSFPVTWIDPDDAVHTYAVPPHVFVVESLLVNEAEPQLRGEDPMISLEYPNVSLAVIIYSVLAGVLLASVLAALFVMWRRRERPVVLPPPVPPHERALADLVTLAGQREALIENGAYQDYYLRLTEIAKRYVGGRFGFEALDRTTEEIQDALRRGQLRVEPLDPKQVMTFLQDCDLVKFARLSPSNDEAREALEVVREMVDRSKPVEGQVEGQVEDPDEGQDKVAGEPGAAQDAAADRERARARRPADPQPVAKQAPPADPSDAEPPAPSPEADTHQAEDRAPGDSP